MASIFSTWLCWCNVGNGPQCLLYAPYYIHQVIHLQSQRSIRLMRVHIAEE